jgi:hypothetical protein
MPEESQLTWNKDWVDVYYCEGMWHVANKGRAICAVCCNKYCGSATDFCGEMPHLEGGKELRNVTTESIISFLYFYDYFTARK